MKRLPILIFFVLLTIACRAQTLSVESFKALDNDLTANTQGTMQRDQNGYVAALIKVVTSETGFSFDNGMLGIVKTVQKTGEIWVYVPFGTSKLTIAHQQLGVLRDYQLPVSVERGRTYELRLMTGTVRTIVEHVQTAQFVVFTVTPSNAVIYVDEEPYSLNSDGQLSLRLSYGNHSYRVEAPSFVSESGTFSVGKEKTKKTVTLMSARAVLTVRTDSDAQIWINEELKGTGTWKGELVAGNYLVEARKPSHLTVFQEVVLKQQEQKELTLDSPQPVYGSLLIESNPLESDIFIDDVHVGETPLLIEKTLIGSHTVKVVKSGYDVISENVDIYENNTTKVSYNLKQSSVESDGGPEEDASSAIAEEMPEFPGGTAAFLEYLLTNVKYPEDCRKNGIQGRVIVSFIVNKDGTIAEPEVVKSVNPSLDKEALRVISKMPNWKPGSQRGKPVRVKYSVPVNFHL